MGAAGFFSGASGAVSSLFSARGHETRAEMYQIEGRADLLRGEGAQLEGLSYTRARELALQNKDYARNSTEIQEAQASRTITMALGAERASFGASGARQSGSALDILADSAQQGELHKQIIGQQGLITQAGYQEQADVYGNMVKASQIAVEGSLLAHQEHIMASSAERTAATGDYITAGIRGVSAIASLFSGGFEMPGMSPGIGID